MWKLFLSSLVLATVTQSLLATQSNQMVFNKVEVRTQYGKAKAGNKGKLIADSAYIRFTKKNEVEEHFRIPTTAVTEIFYSRVSGRRKRRSDTAC